LRYLFVKDIGVVLDAVSQHMGNSTDQESISLIFSETTDAERFHLNMKAIQKKSAHIFIVRNYFQADSKRSDLGTNLKFREFSAPWQSFAGLLMIVEVDRWLPVRTVHQNGPTRRSGGKTRVRPIEFPAYNQTCFYVLLYIQRELCHSEHASDIACSANVVPLPLARWWRILIFSQLYIHDYSSFTQLYCKHAALPASSQHSYYSMQWDTHSPKIFNLIMLFIYQKCDYYNNAYN